MENTTQKPDTNKVVDVRDEEINRLKEENEKLKADLKLQTSLYKFECEQRQSLCHRIEAIKNILEI